MRPGRRAAWSDRAIKRESTLGRPPSPSAAGFISFEHTENDGERMSEAACRWRTIEHTADLAVEMVAPTLERLFETGALALAGVLLGLEAGSWSGERAASAEWREFRLEAPDREALLVDWLRELLYVQMTEDRVLIGGAGDGAGRDPVDGAGRVRRARAGAAAGARVESRDLPRPGRGTAW